MSKDFREEYEFLILHEGWELDNRGWVARFGRELKAFTTSHGGGKYEMTERELKEKIAETEFSLAGLKRALVDCFTDAEKTPPE